MDGETLRDGIFSLHTRRFGTVAELLIMRLVKLGKGRNLFHDLYDELEHKRVEVKFSRVLKKAETIISEDTVLQCIENAVSEHRLVAFSEWESHVFDCNIQQVKKHEFDSLYYGLFFSDCVKIFHITRDEIGPTIFYSDKQHKGNVGEGQFHINQHTLHVHLENYMYRTLAYEQLLDLLTV